MIQRSELISVGITEAQLSSYEDDLSLNLHYQLFNKSNFQYYTGTPNGSAGYALIDLPDTTIMLRNGISTEVEEDTDSIVISDTVTLTAIDPRDTDNFVFTWFGNKIMVDNGDLSEQLTLVCQVVDTSINYLGTEIKRDMYSLIKALYMQDTQMIYSLMQKLSVSAKNKIAENTQLKPLGVRRRRLSLKGYSL